MQPAAILERSRGVILTQWKELLRLRREVLKSSELEAEDELLLQKLTELIEQKPLVYTFPLCYRHRLDLLIRPQACVILLTNYLNYSALPGA